MAITYKAGSLDEAGNASSSDQAITLNVNPAAGDLVIVAAYNFSGSGLSAFTASDCTFSGTATMGAVQVDHENLFTASEGQLKAGIFSSICSVTGSCTATITGEGSLYKLMVIGHAWEADGEGWGASRVIDTDTYTTDSADTTPEIPSMDSTDDSLFFGALCVNGTGDASPAAGTGYTILGDQFFPQGSNETTFGTEYELVTGSASQVVDWTSVDNSTGINAIGVVYQEEAAAGGDGANLLTLLGVG